MATGRGLLRPFALRAYVPSQDVNRVTVRTRSKCRNGTFSVTFTFAAFAYRDGRFSDVVSFPRKRLKNSVEKTGVRFSGTFFRRAGSYRISGELHQRSTFSVGGRQTDSCTLDTRFSGRLKS